MSAAISHSHRHRLVAAPAAIAFATWVAATTLAIDAAQAQAWKGRGSWCAAETLGPGYDCAFYSFEQCMATASGLWSACSPNPLYVPPPPPQVRRLRRAPRR
jgi:hypothetical protein